MAYATFRIPNTIIHGDDALTHLSKLEGKRASIVTGGNSMRKFGFLDETKAQLEKAGMEVQIIDGVEPDPSIKTCKEGGAKMAEFQPDWISGLRFHGTC